MDKIVSIEQLQELIINIRNLRKGFLTNFYLDKFKHSIWIEKGALFYILIDETLFFLKKDIGFSNLFYCSTIVENLSRSLHLLLSSYSETRFMIDAVGTSEQCQTIQTMLSNCQFNEYNKLIRMSRMTPQDDTFVLNDKVEIGSIEDANQVRELLLMNFDIKCEQIPYQEEIDQYAKDKRILVYKENSEVYGFVIFESNRSSHYLRYWFVHPEHRDKKIGSMLLNRFFYEGNNTRRQLFWVITNNENAIKRYRHYGFQEEDLYDIVLSNK